MLQMLIDGIRGLRRFFSDEQRRESGGKFSRLNAPRRYRAALPVVCNLLLAVVMLNPLAARAQTTEIVASGLWNAVTYYPYCNYTELGTLNLTYANGAYSATSYSSNSLHGNCQNTGPESCAAAGFYQSGQDLLSASQFQAMIAAMAVSCEGQDPNIQPVSFTSPDSVSATIIDPSYGSFSFQMTRAASAAVDMTGTWTASMSGTIFSGESGAGQTTWFTLTIVQSGSNVSVTSGYSDTLGRSGSGAVTGSISGNTMASYSIDPDTACASRTITHTVTVTSTAPGQMTDTFTAPASGTCPALSASLIYTKQAASAPTSYALAVTISGTGSNGLGTVTSSPAGIDCGSTCSGSFTSGVTVTLTANPASGSYFAGWSGDCTGTGLCVVTMNAAKNVTATFKPVPFVANIAASAIPATGATITTMITFNAPDVGKPGAVYVTAWVPVNGLGALGISTATLNRGVRVTSTSDNPYITGKVSSMQVDMATLAATDPTAFVLVQLTTSGWQLVQNGQLIPYATGVLGDQLAVQTILNGTNTTNLLGAQFCVGYGTSATEMVTAGRMLPVATILDSSSTTTSNGSCNVTLAPYMGLWWNPNESGWGMSLTQHGSTIANAMYTYDGIGQPTWYTMACPLAGVSCTGDIYRVSGGTPPTVPWNGSGKVVSSAGSGTLTFTDIDNGTFTYTIDNVSGSKSITKFSFATGTTLPTVDYTDLWWNPDESGWGVALTQQYGVVSAAWYSYDATGKAIWYVGTCTVSGSSCSTSDLYQVTGGAPPTSAWHGTNPPTKAGTISFAFTDANNGTMSYTISGVPGSSIIKRLSF